MEPARPWRSAGPADGHGHRGSQHPLPRRLCPRGHACHLHRRGQSGGRERLWRRPHPASRCRRPSLLIGLLVQSRDEQRPLSAALGLFALDSGILWRAPVGGTLGGSLPESAPQRHHAHPDHPAHQADTVPPPCQGQSGGDARVITGCHRDGALRLWRVDPGVAARNPRRREEWAALDHQPLAPPVLLQHGDYPRPLRLRVESAALGLAQRGLHQCLLARHPATLPQARTGPAYPGQQDMRPHSESGVRQHTERHIPHLQQHSEPA